MDTRIVTAAAAVGASLLGILYLYNRNKENSPTEQQEHYQEKQQVTSTSNVPRALEVSSPFNVSKDFTIRMTDNGFEGVPEEIKRAITKAGYTEEQIMREPLLVKDVLYSLDYETIKSSTISTPTAVHHHVHIYINPETKRIEGIPPVVRAAIDKMGYTDEELIASPEIIKQLLYSLNLSQVLSGEEPVQVSEPLSATHDFSVSYDPATGSVSGVPQPILDAIKNAGYTMEEVMRNPMLVKDLLYSFDYASFKPGAPTISAPVSVTHDFSISVDSKGNFTGIPEPIHEAIKKAGYTVEEVMKNPLLVKDLLYEFDYAMLKKATLHISAPIKTSHDFSITINPSTGAVTGVPEEISEAIKNAGYTIQQVLKDPLLVKDLLYNFDYDSLKPSAPKISKPIQVSHDYSITFNNTGEPEGVPEEILAAIKSAGYTLEQVLKNPDLVKDLLYKFDYDALKTGTPKISAPIQTFHDFSITVDPATGQFTGVPEPILEAIKKAGYTIEQVVKDPSLVKDILYSFDYQDAKSSTISKPVNVHHDFSLTVDPTGDVKGIPDSIKEAIAKQGLTLKQVIDDPSLIKETIYEHDYVKTLQETKKN